MMCDGRIFPHYKTRNLRDHSNSSLKQGDAGRLKQSYAVALRGVRFATAPRGEVAKAVWMLRN
jgi:hypothetical protein